MKEKVECRHRGQPGFRSQTGFSYETKTSSVCYEALSPPCAFPSFLLYVCGGLCVWRGYTCTCVCMHVEIKVQPWVVAVPQHQCPPFSFLVSFLFHFPRRPGAISPALPDSYIFFSGLFFKKNKIYFIVRNSQIKTSHS